MKVLMKFGTCNILKLFQAILSLDILKDFILTEKEYIIHVIAENSDDLYRN